MFRSDQQPNALSDDSRNRLLSLIARIVAIVIVGVWLTFAAVDGQWLALGIGAAIVAPAILVRGWVPVVSMLVALYFRAWLLAAALALIVFSFYVVRDRRTDTT